MNTLCRLLFVAAQLGAAVPALAANSLHLKGAGLDGLRFDREQQLGRVPMVMLWRTDCALCLGKRHDIAEMLP